MDAAWPSFAFIALSRVVVVRDLTGTPGREWASIQCASKKAYGCGEIGQKLVEGLTLYVRRLDHLNLASSLSIRLSDKALRSIEAELGAPSGWVEAEGTVQIAHQGLLVLLVVFRRRYHGKLIYYLVYDNTDSSLYIIPYIPRDLDPTCTLAPVPARIAHGQGHELALTAREHLPLHVERHRLCVFSPANPSSDNIGPWKIKVQRFPKLSVASADVTFSLGSKIFWADLARGLAYSDLRTGETVVDTDFIELPGGLYEGPVQVAMKRTVGCVQGKIRFVCISRSEDTGDEIVKMWMLDLVHKLWKEEEDFRCPWKDLCKHIGFMNPELRDVEPQFPVLMPNGDLCLLLLKMSEPMSVLLQEGYICSFDMCRKSPRCYGHFRDYSITGPVILPYNLFMNCFPPPPSQRELPASKRELTASKREQPSLMWQVSKRTTTGLSWRDV